MKGGVGAEVRFELAALVAGIRGEAELALAAVDVALDLRAVADVATGSRARAALALAALDVTLGVVDVVGRRSQWEAARARWRWRSREQLRRLER